MPVNLWPPRESSIATLLRLIVMARQAWHRRATTMMEARFMDVEQLEKDVRAGRIDAASLLRLVKAQQRTIGQLQHRIEDLEKELGRRPTPRVDEDYSVDAEEKRQGEGKPKKPPQKNKPLRRGRITTAEKLEKAEHEFDVYPHDVDPKDCKFSHSRPVWRLIEGRAVLVAYHIYRAGNQFGRIPDVLGRSEFGIEFSVSIAFQVYVLQLSFDKVCQLMSFFQDLKLSKSQADRLLHQLAGSWESEFEHLCTLLAHSAVVHADETGWSIKSVWAFLSSQVRVLFFGVNKDSQTLVNVLNRETFGGVLVSDDAAVYRDFSRAQKCWAHLLRKAIKLTLLEPEEVRYREFTDGLLELYRKARRIKQDRRFSRAGREKKILELQDDLIELCRSRYLDETPTVADTSEHAFKLLVEELMRLMDMDELFTFVVEPEVDGTNNEAERELRPASQARVTGRTNKTMRGARRQTIIHSVLESLRKQLAAFTLGEVVAEVVRWSHAGRSCFSDLVDGLGLSASEPSVLDAVLPLSPD